MRARAAPESFTCSAGSICFAAIAARITPVNAQPIAHTRLIIAP
jgi:hypothetical protein